MSDDLPIGPNPCPVCGGEYGEHDPKRCRRWKTEAVPMYTPRQLAAARREGAREALTRVREMLRVRLYGSAVTNETMWNFMPLLDRMISQDYAAPAEPEEPK